MGKASVPSLTGHERRRELGLSIEVRSCPSWGVQCSPGSRGTRPRDGQWLALTIARQETPRSDGASFAATQHPVLLSWFALLLTRNVRGTQRYVSECSGSAFQLPHQSQVDFSQLWDAHEEHAA